MGIVLPRNQVIYYPCPDRPVMASFGMAKAGRTTSNEMTAVLRERVAQRMKELKLSGRALSEKAGGSDSMVKQILSERSANPRIDTVIELARELGVSLAWLVGESEQKERLDVIPLEEEFRVIGEVQAGAWREALEWSEDDRYSVALPPVGVDKRVPRFGLVVRGDSMNEVFEDGTILVCVNTVDMERWPISGEFVICQRHDKQGLVETTVKQYRENRDGDAFLIPRSSNPAYSSIPLPDNRKAGIYTEAEFLVTDQGFTEWSFGMQAVGNHKFFANLRSGKGVTLTIIERAEAFMREHEAKSEEAA